MFYFWKSWYEFVELFFFSWTRKPSIEKNLLLRLIELIFSLLYLLWMDWSSSGVTELVTSLSVKMAKSQKCLMQKWESIYNIQLTLARWEYPTINTSWPKPPRQVHRVSITPFYPVDFIAFHNQLHLDEWVRHFFKQTVERLNVASLSHRARRVLWYRLMYAVGLFELIFSLLYLL